MYVKWASLYGHSADLLANKSDRYRLGFLAIKGAESYHSVLLKFVYRKHACRLARYTIALLFFHTRWCIVTNASMGVNVTLMLGASCIHFHTSRHDIPAVAATISITQQ